LRDYLTDLLGAGGVVALMGRALKLAKREHPVLAGTTLGTPPPLSVSTASKRRWQRAPLKTRSQQAAPYWPTFSTC
jgi:hypothetical protein